MTRPKNVKQTKRIAHFFLPLGARWDEDRALAVEGGQGHSKGNPTLIPRATRRPFLGNFACDLSFGNFRLWSFAWDSFAWIFLGNFRLMSFALKHSLRNFSFGSFVWKHCQTWVPDCACRLLCQIQWSPDFQIGPAVTAMLQSCSPLASGMPGPGRAPSSAMSDEPATMNEQSTYSLTWITSLIDVIKLMNYIILID